MTVNPNLHFIIGLTLEEIEVEVEIEIEELQNLRSIFSCRNKNKLGYSILIIPKILQSTIVNLLLVNPNLHFIIGYSILAVEY